MAGVKPYVFEALPVVLQLRTLQPDATLNTATLPPDIKEKLIRIKEVTESMRSVQFDVSGGREQMRGAVKELTSRVMDIDTEG